MFSDKLPQGEVVSIFNNVQYNIPGLFLCSPLIYRFLDIVMMKYGYVIPIKYLYGSPDIKWNGGRLMFNRVNSFNDIESIEKELITTKEKGVKPLLTFSNFCINENDLNDVLGNHILSIVNEIEGGVIVVSPLLKKYIQNNFRNIEIHASVISTSFSNNRDIQYYRELSDNNHFYVIHPDDVFNYDLLKNLPTKNAEIMVNERCYLGCEFRNQHYQVISKEQLYHDDESNNSLFLKNCIAIPEWKQSTSKIRNLSLTIEEIQKIINMGFHILKLQGRADNLYVLFFEIMRYTLDNKIVFPNLFPIFASEIQKFYIKMSDTI